MLIHPSSFDHAIDKSLLCFYNAASCVGNTHAPSDEKDVLSLKGISDVKKDFRSILQSIFLVSSTLEDVPIKLTDFKLK